MTNTYRFEIPGPPVPAPRMTRAGVHTAAHPKRSMMDRYLSHKADIGWAAKAAGVEPTTAPVSLHLAFYEADQRKRDLSNMIKTVEDGLNRIAYADDSQIVRLTAGRELDRDNPRTLVQITVEESA